MTLSTTTSCEIRNCTKIHNKNLRHLTRDAFKHTSKWSKIECMSFQDDVFDSIETALFSNFRSLRILHMKNIPMLGKGIISGFEDINITKLTQLCLENVNLTTAVILPLFTKLNKRLKVLSLKNNPIESFSFENIDNLFKIKSLILSGNKQLVFSPQTSKPFTYLKTLDLSYTRSLNSTFCPNKINNIPNLKTLCLDGIRFRLADIDIDNCFNNLKMLVLSNSHIQDGIHNDSFSHFPNLTYLQLSGLGYTKQFKMPTFSKNMNLTTLKLNCIAFLFPPTQTNTNAFEYLIKLSVLDLSNWDLSQWSSLNISILFAPFKESITTLKLSKVGFETIPNIIWEMPNLNIVTLSNNKISSLDPQRNSTIVNMTRLHLQWNRIETLDPGSIPQSVSDLNLSGNPFSCKCPLMQYVLWEREKKDVKVMTDWYYRYHCATPREWKGRNLLEFARKIKPTDCRAFNTSVIVAAVLCFIMIAIVVVTNIIVWRKRKLQTCENRPLLPKV